MIETQGLTVAYTEFVLGPIDLTLAPGIHALIGPNGAGKTTFVSAALGLQRIDGGGSRVLDQWISGRHPEVLQQVGLVSDSRRELLEELTPWEYWTLVARVRSSSATEMDDKLVRAEELAEEIAFEAPDRPIAELSLGMSKKTQVVGALLHDPPVVVMDEPRNGLDPLSIELLERILSSLRQRGCCVLVATHDLRWADRVADRVHVLAGGRLLASGAPAELRHRAEESLVDVYLRLVSAT